MGHESDDQIDRLLRRALEADARTEAGADCLDAEALAAWVEGRLSGPMQRSTVDHLSTCARCQAIVAELARMAPPSAAPAWWQRSLRLRWLVPVTAAAAALVIWMVMPEAPPPRIDEFAEGREAVRRAEPDVPIGAEPGPTKPAAPPAQVTLGRAAPAERERAQEAAPAASLEAPTAAPRARDDQLDVSADRVAPIQAEEAKKEVSAGREEARTRAVATPAPASAKPAGPGVRAVNETTALAQRAAIQAFDVTSPDRSVTWRIERAGRISRSADSGSRWEVVSEGLGMNMVAGTSPSAEVCWIVGRAGLVLLAIDGRRFTRLPFPEITDLAAVQAADGRTAQVTALGGRTFRTTDGGQTWVEARPQDF